MRYALLRFYVAVVEFGAVRLHTFTYYTTFYIRIYLRYAFTHACLRLRLPHGTLRTPTTHLFCHAHAFLRCLSTLPIRFHTYAPVHLLDALPTAAHRGYATRFSATHATGSLTGVLTATHSCILLHTARTTPRAPTTRLPGFYLRTTLHVTYTAGSSVLPRCALPAVTFAATGPACHHTFAHCTRFRAGAAVTTHTRTICTPTWLRTYAFYG